MKNLNELNRYRFRNPMTGRMGNDRNGSFKIMVNGRSFIVIASNSGGWEHVGITLKNQKRLPTWEEMCIVREIFFKPDEDVVMFIPSGGRPKEKYMTHIWRPLIGDLVVPAVYN